MQEKPSLGVSVLCFNQERVLERSLSNLKSLYFGDFEKTEIFVFDPGYPGKSTALFRDICRKYGAWYVEMPNRGQTLNILASVPYLEKFDYVLGWEPDGDISDTRYLSIAKGWLDEDPELGYICPRATDWVYEAQGPARKVSSDSEAREIKFVGGWPQLFYRGECWRQLKNLQASCKGPYGGTEYDIWKAVHPWKGLMLRNVVDRVDQSLFDESFQKWKHETIGKGDQEFYEQSTYLRKE
jgi:hypothetical protein